MAIAALATAARPAIVQGAKIAGVMIGAAAAYGVALPVMFRVFTASAKITDAALDAPGKGVRKFRNWREKRRQAAQTPEPSAEQTLDRAA